MRFMAIIELTTTYIHTYVGSNYSIEVLYCTVENHVLY